MTKDITEEITAIKDIDDLKGVFKWLQTEKEKSVKEGKSWSWVFALVVAVIAFFALAIAAFKAWKRGREIAKLKHKIDVDKENRIQAEEDAKVTNETEKLKELAAEVNKLDEQIKESLTEVAELEEKRKAENAKIDKITSWAELDKYMDANDD